MHRWWDSDSTERFWLEITDRPDLGVDLRAPQTRDNRSRVLVVLVGAVAPRMCAGYARGGTPWDFAWDGGPIPPARSGLLGL